MFDRKYFQKSQRKVLKMSHRNKASQYKWLFHLSDAKTFWKMYTLTQFSRKSYLCCGRYLWAAELARVVGCRWVVVSMRLRGVSECILHHQGLQGRGLEVCNRYVALWIRPIRACWGEAVHHLWRGCRGQHCLSVNQSTRLTPPHSRGGSSWHNIRLFSHKKSK